MIRTVVANLRERGSAIHILGGPEIAIEDLRDIPERGFADYYVIGEGEVAFTNLISFLKNRNGNYESLAGIAYRNDGRLFFTPSPPRIIDLDTVPSIYLSGVLDDSLYARRQVFLETQRGCTFRCAYCVYHKHLKDVRYYSLERVFAEIDFLVVEKEVYAVRIFDANFTSDLERAKDIVRHLVDLKRNDIRLSWLYWEFNYYCCDDEFLSLVSQLKTGERISNTDELAPMDKPQLYSDMLRGYTAINCIGIQSFNKASLKAIRRSGGNPEAMKQFMLSARKHNIVLKIDLILGLPLETYESYIAGLDCFLPFFKNTDHVLNIHRLQILPGSDLVEICKRHGVAYSQEAPHIVYATDAMSREELEDATRRTAVLFRIVNSPLRRYFFAAAERKQCGCMALVGEVYAALRSDPSFAGTGLLKQGYLYDTYWNDDVFKEIPSQWLIDVLEQ